MSMTKLEQARHYEAIHGAGITPGERPLFHLTPLVGWMNDPNGFSLYRGEYHLFYQYYPYETKWGPMHWGHAKSQDLLHWEWLPAALAPEDAYDNAGCFSGSAIELEDGRQMLLYTGVQQFPTEDGGVGHRQVQCVAYGDGVDYQKYEGNPVITARQLPEGGSSVDFRDPKVWKEDDGWYAVVGNRASDGSGAVLLFRSEDTVHWDYAATLEECRNEYGRMWECPDFFPLDGRYIVIASPQEMQARGLEFHNGNSTLYSLGDYERKTRRFRRAQVRSLDYGLDFYAPQTTLTPDGRRVLIGWMQSWESCGSQPVGAKWFGMMTVPRELSVRDGQLIQTPIRELDGYRVAPVHYSAVKLQNRVQLPGVEGRTIDLTVRFRAGEPGGCRRFAIRIAADERFATVITYFPTKHILRIDRRHSGFPYDVVHIRDMEVRRQGEALKLRILLDRFSAEIFVNDGEQVLSSTLYTPQSARGVSFEAEGSALIDVEKFDLAL